MARCKLCPGRATVPRAWSDRRRRYCRPCWRGILGAAWADGVGFQYGPPVDLSTAAETFSSGPAQPLTMDLVRQALELAERPAPPRTLLVPPELYEKAVELLGAEVPRVIGAEVLEDEITRGRRRRR